MVYEQYRYDKDTSDRLTNYYLEAARDRIKGVQTIHKFGLAENLDSGDGNAFIWDGTSDDPAGAKIPNYTFSTSADITRISTTSAVGAQVIEIHGLDANWDMVTQFITLQGQTPVSLSTPLIRVNRMINRGSSNILGTVYLSTSGATITGGIPTPTNTVRAIIHGTVTNEHNQTQMAIYSVPKDHDFHIVNTWAGLASNVGTITLRLYRRDFGGVFRVFRTIALDASGSTLDHYPYVIPICVGPKSDIAIRASSDSVNTAISAGFDGLLIQRGTVR